MLSRTLSLATVTLLIGYLAATPVRAQAQNLEAGKSPSQIFTGTCTACHKSPRGLLKTVPAGSLPGFLRQHYTTSSDMASLLSAFLISNGAADTRLGGAQTRQGKDAKPEAKPGAEPQQAARPDADGLGAQGEPGRPGRNAKRLARPGEAPDAAKPAADGHQPPAHAAIAPGHDGRKSAAKQKLGKKGKPDSEEPSRSDAAKDEPVKGEAAKEDAPKSDTAREEATKPSESARVDAPKEDGEASPKLRPDPVPPVTPAPAGSAAVSSGALEPAAAAAQPVAPAPAAPAVTASAPPVPPAGPPVPPISQ
jgi:hypothetical protein